MEVLITLIRFYQNKTNKDTPSMDCNTTVYFWIKTFINSHFFLSFLFILFSIFIIILFSTLYFNFSKLSHTFCQHERFPMYVAHIIIFSYSKNTMNFIIWYLLHLFQTSFLLISYYLRG